MIPNVLKNLTLFMDGEGYAGKVIELGLPKLTLKTAEYRGGGMDAPVEIDEGMEKVEATFTMSGQEIQVQKAFGVEGTRLVFRGAFVRGGEVIPAVATCVGKLKENDPGTWKPGDNASGQLKSTMACDYYQLEIGGEVVHEIDVVNMKRVIAGVDQLEAQRQALGL